MGCFDPNQQGDELESLGKGLQYRNQDPKFFLGYNVDYITYNFSPLFFQNLYILLYNGLQALENAKRHL